MRFATAFCIHLSLSILLNSMICSPVAGQTSARDVPALDLIENLQDNTDFRFLFREPLIAGINVRLAENDTALNQLISTLKFSNIEVQVDSARKQVVIYRDGPKTAGQNMLLDGQVLDASTGERLPLATITWKQDGRIKGTNCTAAGTFNINKKFKTPILTLRVSYVGYQTETFEIDLRNQKSIHDLTFRLAPVFLGGEEIVVTASSLISSIDKSLQQSVDAGAFSPLGESNTIRALQQLPAVQTNTALENGLNVRGSPSDGFRVMLDGITIYNQTHLFGLVDSFNPDAILRSELYYDIIPAQFSAPPGGILALNTQTGSLNHIEGTAGLTNSGYRLTVQGPLKKGTSSWLLSGRSSFLNGVNWFNNSDLIQWGLNVDRPKEITDNNLSNVEAGLVQPGANRARFFDLHGKVYWEQSSGSRFILSGYYGQDDTRQDADRLFRRFSSQQGSRTKQLPVNTNNRWSNLTSSIQYQRPLSSNLYAYSSLGFSIYRTDFKKDDFSYARQNQSTNNLFLFNYLFKNKSILNEVKAAHRFEFDLFNIQWTAGAEYHFYSGEYFEDSFDRPGYFRETEAHQVDGYTQLNFSPTTYIDLRIGSRLHYYSNGGYLKFSPRLRADFFPDRKVSAHVGYSKNYQFLNEISLSNIISSNIWILADEQQAPVAVDYYSVGISAEPLARTFFQVEGYLKQYQNVRLHEIDTFSISNSFGGSPWFFNNSGEGKGIEFFLKNSMPAIALSHSFTVSEMQLQNPFLNNGDPFFVDWDRRYQYASTLELRPLPNLSLFASWTYATGTPNKLAVFGPENDQRLDDYMRTDLSIEYRNELAFGALEASATVYNVFDRQNPWYRELSFFSDESDKTFRQVPVNVYDLGIQPSFNVSLSF